MGRSGGGAPPPGSHAVGSKVWVRDGVEGWIKGEVLRVDAKHDALLVAREDGVEVKCKGQECELQNQDVRGVEVCMCLCHPCVFWR